MLSLPDLPLEVIEAICRPLQLRDRVALTSCCRTLLARPDVASSPLLWGSLGRTIDLGSTKESPPAGFLARRAAGLRTLDVELVGSNEGGVYDDLAALLSTLGGSGLLDLEIFDCRGLGRDPGAALQPLSRLTTLTQLVVSGGMEAVPAHLSALQGLAHLELSGNEGLGRSSGPAAFEGLDHLLALTSLGLSDYGLDVLPPQLSSLTRLQVLLLHDNPRLGEEGEAVFEYLQCLPALRTLDLSRCGLLAVPRQLAALPALEALELGMNKVLGWTDPAEAFAVLCQLTGLTSLSIRGCQLTRAPPQLASLTALAELELGNNPWWTLAPPSYGWEVVPTFQPLELLTAVTRLDLSGGNALRCVPPQVAALTGLLELDLSGNTDLGDAGKAAFQPLLHLSGLTRLNLGGAGLRSLPPQLSALGGCLLRLELPNNRGLGRYATVQSFQSLRHATALTALDLRHCLLKWLPDELSALAALQELELGGYKGLKLGDDYHYKQVFGALRHLRGLTHLRLYGGGLVRLPPQLSELRALRVLDVSGNKALGRGQPGNHKMWRQLSCLAVLERLDVVGCGLRRPAPPALLELVQRGVDVEGLPGRTW